MLAFTRWALGVDELILEPLVSSAMSLHDAKEHRRTDVGPLSTAPYKKVSSLRPLLESHQP